MILYHTNLLCKNFVFHEYVCSSKQCQINNIITFEVYLNNIQSVASSNCKQTHEESSYKRASYLNLFSKRSKFYVQTICASSASKYFAKKLNEASEPAINGETSSSLWICFELVKLSRYSVLKKFVTTGKQSRTGLKFTWNFLIASTCTFKHRSGSSMRRDTLYEHI